MAVGSSRTHGADIQQAQLKAVWGDLQPLALPDTLDPLVVDCPAHLAQQFGDLAIAIAAVLPSKLDLGQQTVPYVLFAAVPDLRSGRQLAEAAGDLLIRPVSAIGKRYVLEVG